MAATAARPATAIELPTVLAAPLKLEIGELVALGGLTLECLSDAGIWQIEKLEMTYAPVDAVPEGAATAAAPPAGTMTGEPGLGGSLPDGEADPDAPDSPMDGEPVEAAAAGVGVAVTVK